MLIYLAQPPLTETFNNYLDKVKPYFSAREILLAFFYSEYFSSGSYESFSSWKERMISTRMITETITAKSVTDSSLDRIYHQLKGFYSNDLTERALRSTGSDNFLTDISFSETALILKISPLPF